MAAAADGQAVGHLPALTGARVRRALAAHATLLAGAVLAALPLLWLVSLSLQEPEAVFRYPPRFIPERVLWT